MQLSESKKETRDSFKNRAIIYYYLFDEMRQEFGQELAERIFRRAIYRRGKDISALYRKAAEKGDFRAVATQFKVHSPCEGELFLPGIERADDYGCVVTMEACPLVDAWKELGLSEDEIALMCDLASEIDLGTFESAGLEIEFDGKLGQGDPHCRLCISKVHED